MKLLVIVVNYKTPDMTLDAVRAALRQLAELNQHWKLAIVDNNSGDGSYDTIDSAIKQSIAQSEPGWDQVDLIGSDTNGGFGAGNNLAINRYLDSGSAPEYFYMMNSDAFPEKDSISKLLDQLESQPEAGIAGSYIHGPDGEPHVTAFRFPTILGELEGSVRLGPVTRLLKNYVVPVGIPDRTRAVDWLAGASMMIRREVIEQVGGFDETFFLYFEETDLCRRAGMAGWKTVYVPGSSVSHIGSVSTGMKQWQRIPGYWLDSRRYYFVKNHGAMYFVFATLSRILGQLIWNLRILLEGKPRVEPKKFLGDLTRHFIRSMVVPGNPG